MGTKDILESFYETIAEDGRIGSNHISLYMSLLQCSLKNGNPFTSYRKEIMELARLSRRTYNKCMGDLQDFGYIRYTPSYNPRVGSRIYLNRLM